MVPQFFYILFLPSPPQKRTPLRFLFFFCLASSIDIGPFCLFLSHPLHNSMYAYGTPEERTAPSPSFDHLTSPRHLVLPFFPFPPPKYGPPFWRVLIAVIMMDLGVPSSYSFHVVILTKSLFFGQR